MIGWPKIASVRTGYANSGDFQRCLSRARDGHLLRDLIADLHRPKVQAVWAKAGLRMDHGRLQLDSLRASASVVGDVEFGPKRTYLLGIGVNLDGAAAPGRQL